MIFFLGSIYSYDDVVKRYRESQAQLNSDSRSSRTKSTSSQFSVSYVYLQGFLEITFLGGDNNYARE